MIQDVNGTGGVAADHVSHGVIVDEVADIARAHGGGTLVVAGGAP